MPKLDKALTLERKALVRNIYELSLKKYLKSIKRTAINKQR